MNEQSKKQWMTVPGGFNSPEMAWFKLETCVDESGVLEFEFSADETCQIFLDGTITAYGPGHSAANYWLKQKCTLKTSPGRHLLTVRVLALGKFSAQNQFSVRNGFYCTLQGNWMCRKVSGITYAAPWPDWGVYARFATGKDFDYTAQAGGGEWVPAEFFDDERILYDSMLPQLIHGTVTPGSVSGDLVKFDDYECLWSTWHFSGKGTVSIRWCETGYLSRVFSHHNLKGEKGRRDGKFFIGNPDTFTIDGECSFTDIQWRAGRYAQISCTGTAKVEKMEFRRTGYPFNYSFDINDVPEKYRQTMQMAKRTLECCSHDLFMDCPHYERLMYIGDARMEALCTYAAAGDSVIARKALKLFAMSQQENGAILSRFPAKVEQMIPSFVEIFILMLHDFMMWNDDRDFVQEIIPAARRAADYLISCRRDDGLLYPPGWNFIDWIWPQRGIPYGSDCGTNSIINLLAVLALKQLARLEEYCDCPDAAALRMKQSEELFQTVREIYFADDTGLFADDKEHKFYSEHAQVLAMLSHDLPDLWDNMPKIPKLTACGIYFSSYYLEAARIYGKTEQFEQRLEQWCDLAELGLKTLPEEFTMPRSDCHAWSSHILYHWLCLTGKAEPKCKMDFKY